LFQAVQDNKKDVVNSLLKGKDLDTLKAILHARNTDSKTLLQVAGVNKQGDIPNLLVEKLRVVQFSDQQQETIHQGDEVSAEECLPVPSHRKKINTESECLFTWEECRKR
jgi:hypothetical protein